ncbi:aspartate aminotransferase family protein [Microvirga sp. VF16]|uniref:aspartate aminotransferase family protein n=1 Tax=Microvirga sp. VF16 TaxID=2807101 RepID=UPI00193E51B0|nr:aminotransferase class III-fold pyridoxal phosphate-dependent enzyme [Microvirga sp. VF16]QRM32219.1 aminotransferase class III-fold pyridoxal phosphate-dependent enzyme [Microvirga sp. VF16]
MLKQNRTANYSLEQVLDELERDYIASHPKSAAHVKRAAEVLPGGSTRTVLHFDPFPLVIARASGSQLVDLDGHTYTDFANDFTAAFYGHSDPVVVNALIDAIKNGLSFGGLNVYEEKLAREICSRFDSIDRVRFCNSGTEANLIALQLAKQATGRSKILAFTGGYHGSMLSFLGGKNINYGTSDFVFADFNSEESVEAAVAGVLHDLAAIVVEPMIGSGGGILAEVKFLSFLRNFSQKHGALLIFDEVQTARMARGGLQEIFGIRPDLTTLGKFLGGGGSFGAFGGAAAFMDLFDATRQGAIPHGGTFNNNIMSMAAGYAGYSRVGTPEAIAVANNRAAGLRQSLTQVAESAGVPIQLGGYGTIISIHFQSSLLTRPADIRTNAQQRKLVHLELLRRHVYAARRGTINLSLANSDEDVDHYVRAFADICEAHSPLLQN